MDRLFKLMMIGQLLSVLTLTGCILKKNKLTMVIEDRSTDNPNPPILSNVSVVNNQLVINGSNLAGVASVKMTGSGFDETFDIQTDSTNDNTLVANSLRNISLLVAGTFSLILSDAQGAPSTFQVTFTLQDGVVTASKLSDMGAGVGNVLKYNGTTWVPGDLSALVYAGIWNASTNSPDLTTGGAAGEYFIVENAGGSNPNSSIGGAPAPAPALGSWVAGDWGHV